MAVFLAEGNRGNQEWRTALERTAQELGVELYPVEVHGPDDIKRALSTIAHGQAEALVVSDASRLGLHAKQIGDLSSSTTCRRSVHQAAILPHGLPGARGPPVAPGSRLH